MPGIEIFHRRWGVGSDDFVFPMAAEIPIRVIWLIVLAAVLGAHSDSFTSCHSGYLLRLYYIGTLVLLSLTIFLSAMIMYKSMLGSIMDPELRRKHIPLMVALKLLLFLPEIAWIALGTSWAFGQDGTSECASHVVYVIRGATVVGWILVVILIIIICLVFDPMGRPSVRYSEEERSKRLWKLRCKLLCCCVALERDDSSSAFEDVSRLLADYFFDSNYVVTDIAAGLILVQHQQMQRQNVSSLRRYNMPPITAIEGVAAPSDGSGSMSGTSTDPPSWMNLKMAGHYMKFALASYGWMFFVYDNRCTGPGRLWCKCKCCSCVRHHESEIHGDNCCRCNTSAILQQTKIQPEDIIYANFSNKLYEIPFYIALDHDEKTVVVAVRGTLSFYDALTDLTVHSEDITVGNVLESKAHKGILHAAKYIQTMISKNNLLDEAFARAPGYRLVLTGHSLGAGAAAILSILLRPIYPDLMCFAFSPPGWLVSISLSRYAEDFICSVVVGKDLVPRMGIITMTNLKAQVARAVRNCNTPKYRILVSGLTKVICNWFLEDFSQVDIDINQTDHLLSSSSNEHRRYTEEQPASATHQRQSMLDNPHPLYMPGHILYLEETIPAKGCCGTARYEAFWSKPEYFNEVLVSTEMLTDHMPNVVYRALHSAADVHEVPRAVASYNSHGGVV